MDKVDLSGMDEVVDLVETNMHGYVQHELAELKACAPSMEAKKKYFDKNVGAYYKAMNETVGTDQKIKVGGYGNASTKNLTINMNNLGLVDKQRLLAEMMGKLKALGDKMGYGKEVVEKEEIISREALPEIENIKNRIKE